MTLCSVKRCEFPISGIGEKYGMCVQHGHEERNRVLAERDAKAKPAAPPVAPRPVTDPPRPLSAIVGARPTPTPIAPSAATQLAKESLMPREFRLRPDADAHPELCRNDGCDRRPASRGVCPSCCVESRSVGQYEAIAAPSRKGKVGRGKGESARGSRLPPETKRPPVVPVVDTSHPTIQAKISDAERRELADLRQRDAENTATIKRLDIQSATLVKENYGLRDALAASDEKLRVLVAFLHLDPAKDLAPQARDIMAWHAVATYAANLFDVASPTELFAAIDDAVTETRIDTPTIAICAPPDRLYDIHQLGHHRAGIHRGHVDHTGLFRGVDGTVLGAVFSAVPVERPELGEPGPDEDVWVRTSIDEVTATNIHTADGGRYRRSEWGPGRFARPVQAKVRAKPRTVGDDDIPF